MRFKTLFSFLFILFSFLCLSQDLQLKSIEYKGLKKTKSSFIQKISELKEGQTTDSLQIEKDIQNLRRLPSISYVRYEIKKTELSNDVQLIYHFEENITLLPNVAVWTSVNETTIRVGATETNLFGSNKSIGGFYQYNGFNTVNLNFRDNFLFSKKIGLSASFTDWRSEEPLFFQNGSTANYKFNNRSFELLGLYRPSFNHRIQLGINPFREEYELLEGDVPEGIPTVLEENKFLVKSGYEYNNLNFFYYFVSGFRTDFNFQYVTTQNFFIGWNDFFYYKRIKDRGNLATRFRFGLASNDTGPFAPFALDNNVNIRGVGNIIDRGTAMLVLNTEYRHSVYEKEKIVLQGNVFFDGGTWRQPGGTLNDFWQNENMRLHTGIGARLILKKVFGATFRVDYGFDIKEPKNNGIVFGIGQYF